jgi:hypothetical protein
MDKQDIQWWWLAGKIALAVYGLAFIVFNASQSANVWLGPFWTLKGVSTLVVILLTGVIAVVLTWLFQVKVSARLKK